MQEQSIIIVGEFDLEAGLALGSGPEGVVLVHPHPLYGGEMRNPVITAMMRTFQEHDWSTLRFNFRGVGASCGTYDEGRGEVDDLLAAVDCLRQEGVERVLLAGYSFGAWVIFRAAIAGKLEEARTIYDDLLENHPDRDKYKLWYAEYLADYFPDKTEEVRRIIENLKPGKNPWQVTEQQLQDLKKKIRSTP